MGKIFSAYFSDLFSTLLIEYKISTILITDELAETFVSGHKPAVKTAGFSFGLFIM